MTVLRLSTSINVDCIYYTNSWTYLDNIYWCFVTNDFTIKSRDTSMITSVSGTHSTGKDNDDIRGLSIVSKIVNFFPKGIEIFFKNIQILHIYSSNLQEITQSDISVFPKLIFLHLTYNNLKVLEQGLLDFNPKLRLLTWKLMKYFKFIPMFLII